MSRRTTVCDAKSYSTVASAVLDGFQCCRAQKNRISDAFADVWLADAFAERSPNEPRTNREPSAIASAAGIGHVLWCPGASAGRIGSLAVHGTTPGPHAELNSEEDSEVDSEVDIPESAERWLERMRQLYPVSHLSVCNSSEDT